MLLGKLNVNFCLIYLFQLNANRSLIYLNYHAEYTVGICKISLYLFLPSMRTRRDRKADSPDISTS